MCALGGGAYVEGFAKVERGDALPSRLVAELFRFPSAGQNISVSVNFIVNDYRKTW